MITIIRKRSTATHARLMWLEDVGLRIEWGYIKCLTFRPVSVETLMFSDFPELKSLHDGIGWNLDELQSLLDDADGTALPEAVTVLLTQKDINLLSSRGLELAL